MLKLPNHTLKILWAAHRDPFNPRAGGAERTIREVCIRLIKGGHKVTLLTGGFKGCKTVDNLQGVKIYRFGKYILPHLALPYFLIKYRYDIVVNDLGHAVPWVLSGLFGKKNVAFFRHLHARSLPGQVNLITAKLLASVEKYYPIIYRDAVFVIESSASRRDLIKLGIHGNRIFTIKPGVDKELFRPTAKTHNPTLVYFGGMRRYKRPEESIYLLENLITKLANIRLIIIGSGPEGKSLKKLAMELRLSDSITFMGKVTNEELAKTVASSWLNIHSSVTEGWGLSILEASASGTPTVAYRVSGVEDVIEDGINGLKVLDGDRASLANAAFIILSNPKNWWLSSLNVANKYSWEETVQAWENLFNKLNRAIS